MTKLLSAFFAVALAAVPVAAQGHERHHASSAGVAGNWQMSFDTPHGKVHGDLKMKQEGTNLTGSCDVENIGAFTLTGKIDGDKISLDMQASGGNMSLKLTGTLDHEKMSGTMEHGEGAAGAWSAVRP
jgi:hypothetical protein